ncbi:MAG: helicase [Clostridia bacterium]|nr:helicase [Clostridia bacterium]
MSQHYRKGGNDTDQQEALALYARLAAAEQERWLDQAALKKARSITRGLSGAEKEKYLKSQSFINLQYQVRRRDRIYQALKRGELPSSRHQEEYERLKGLIISETDHGHDVSLPFLRSLIQCRVPAEKAHAALRSIQNRAVPKYFGENRARLIVLASEKAKQYLLEGDLSGLVPQGQKTEWIVPHVLKTAFENGISTGVINRSFLPGSLYGVMIKGLRDACPQIASCGGIVLPSGEKISTYLKNETYKERNIILREVRRCFPEKELNALLQENESLRQLQKQADAAFAREKKIRAALLDAVPEHYRDLYPPARAMHRRFILHLGPTNSGKTYEGVQRLRGAVNGIYLGPLRLLAAEQFETLNLDNVPCSLVTGEEQIRVPGSRVQSSTVEMADLKAHYDVAVIDECQLVADRDRGGAWTAAILGLCADEIHACASPDAEGLLTRMILDCGDSLEIVRHERMTPLEVEKEGFQFPGSVRSGDALIVFSKARVHAVAAELRGMGYRVSLIYGALPPDVRRDQAERFQHGDTEVCVSTDAIAMGMNLPIQRVVFLEPEKYDGDITRSLTDAEIKQIAGRAGRYGIYDIGFVNAYGFKGQVANALYKPLLPLTEAVIRFPESLLGIPLPLTKIIEQWIAIQDRGFFSKASTARMAALAAMMETKHTDKQLLYRFLCIPFDETEQDLLSLWKTMYQAERDGEHVDVLELLPRMFDPDECVTSMLDGLEADYRKCDLYYNYARLFLDDPDRILEEIQRRKDLISRGIIRILSTQKLQTRTCRSCKRRLPWNWPYRLCDSCYRRHSTVLR